MANGKGFKVIGSLVKSLLSATPIVGDAIDIVKNLKEDTTNQVFNGSHAAGSFDWARLIGKTLITAAIIFFLWLGYSSGAFTPEQAIDILQQLE